MKRLFTMLACLGVLAFGQGGVSQAAEEPAAKQESPAAEQKPVKPAACLNVGDPVVNFTLKGHDGKPVSLSKVYGKKATAVFWSQSACSLCRRELQRMPKLQQEFPDVSFVVIMVDVNPDVARQTVDNFKVAEAATVVYDPEFTTGPMYGVFSTPFAVIISGGKATHRLDSLSPRVDVVGDTLKSL